MAAAFLQHPVGMMSVRSLKNQQPELGTVVHTCNLSIQEVEAEGSQASGQPVEFQASLVYIVRPCLKK
jgi:hypothetical protein